MSGEPINYPAERGRDCIGLVGASTLDRLAYRLLLLHALGRQVAVEADFTPASIWTALRSRPNLAIIDTDTASRQAVDAVQMISRLQPATRILVVGGTVDPAQLEPWGRCRIHGYVVKDAGVEEFRLAVDTVLDSRQYFSEGVRSAVRRSAGRAGNGPRLSRREAELLPLLAHGLTLREAAQKMTIAYKTADAYRSSLLRKLGLRDRVELARYAIREHIIDP